MSRLCKLGCLFIAAWLAVSLPMWTLAESLNMNGDNTGITLRPFRGAGKMSKASAIRVKKIKLAANKTMGIDSIQRLKIRIDYDTRKRKPKLSDVNVTSSNEDVVSVASYMVSMILGWKGFTLVAMDEGQATITVTVGGKSAQMVVTVSSKIPTYIELEADTLTMQRGATFQLNHELYPESAIGEIRWKSSNSKVASVDQQGLITAKANGSAWITVSCGKKLTDKCKVIIKKETSAPNYSRWSDWSDWSYSRDTSEPIGELKQEQTFYCYPYLYYYYTCPSCKRHMPDQTICQTFADGCGAPMKPETKPGGWSITYGKTTVTSTDSYDSKLRSWFGTNYQYVPGSDGGMFKDPNAPKYEYRYRTRIRLDSPQI